MKKILLPVFFFLCGMILPAMIMANTAPVMLQHAPVDLNDKASLQRGAGVFMNYCSGCHSLKYMRYQRVAKDIGIVDSHGEVDANLVKNNLIFTGDKIQEPIMNAMPLSSAKNWFGVPPPDLSLEARVRGADWIYSYLLGFYEDAARPFGFNNVVFPEVAMPNVLANLQGVQVPHFHHNEAGDKIVDYLVLKSSGKMDTLQFQAAVADVVNFLVYVGEPNQLERKHIGWWVLLFLSVFVVLTYLLKREYWRDVH